VKIEGSRIYLPKVGWVKCVVHREIVGKVKMVTISRDACGQFHAAILTDNGGNAGRLECRESHWH
jgi:putative transposase